MQHKECIKVLFVLGSLEVGGVQSGIMNFVKLCDSNKVKIDVLVLTEKIGFHEKELSNYSEIFHLPQKCYNGKLRLFGFFNILYNNILLRNRTVKFLNKHTGYDVVHSKALEYSASMVEAAKKCNIPVRIAQSHVDKPDRLNPFHKWYYKWCAKRIEKNATVKLAVSEKAVDLMFGKYGGRVIQNPTISLKRLDPSKYPKQPHEGINLIQIGTYSHRKNQCFSVDILNSLLKSGRKVKLTFVGFPLDEPDYINQVQQKVTELNLSDYVEFLPKDSDVPKLLAESDYMLIPSLREGLPNVALEAQAMGVPCFLSDTIYQGTDCGLCTFSDLNDGADFWAEKIIEYRNKFGTEKRYVDMSMWDNENVVKEYIKIWTNDEK